MPATPQSGHSRRIDLNLVRLFVAVYETRSVSQAAERLCVTQPTVSYGLAGLRRMLQDSLFVRTRAGMEPTLQAIQMYREFVDAIARIDAAVADSQHFTPAQSQRRFLVAMSDIGELIFLPPIMEHLRRQAPNVELEIVEAAAPDLARRLATGEVSAAIGNLPALLSETRTQTLFEERYVCLLRRKHSSIGRKLSVAEFAAARHVLVSSGLSGHNLLEETLRGLGIQRRIGLQIPHFAILGNLIANSDLLAMLPSRVAKFFAAHGDVRSLDLPVALPRFQVRLHWHERDDLNVAGKWLRAAVADALRGI
ncbi:MAG: LysR family transcriptional regulator [Proteobacteria bacterium]|nr:LysR family transcriptional regulator [Pseudomonadota bacterium]